MLEGAVVRHHDINWVKKCVETFEEVELNHITFTTMNGNKSNGYHYLGENVK